MLSPVASRLYGVFATIEYTGDHVDILEQRPRCRGDVASFDGIVFWSGVYLKMGSRIRTEHGTLKFTLRVSQLSRGSKLPLWDYTVGENSRLLDCLAVMLVFGSLVLL